MKNYLKYLQSIQKPKNFQRKIDYIEYNFSKFFNNKNISVLEIGPGLGEFINLLNSQGIKHIDIIDNNKEILDFLKNKYNIGQSFLTQDISKIDKQLKQYDIIFLLQVFEHISVNKYKSFIKTLYSHLKIQGKIIITVPNGGNPFCSVERYSDLTHKNVFTDNSLKQLPDYVNLKNYSAQVNPYLIPPYNLINIFRIFCQKIVHQLIKLIIIINGGVYPKILTPNLSLIITKNK